MARQQRAPSQPKERRRPSPRRPRPVKRAEEPTTPAEEWGEREATGKIIESGGHNAGVNPAHPEKRA